MKGEPIEVGTYHGCARVVKGKYGYGTAHVNVVITIPFLTKSSAQRTCDRLVKDGLREGR